MEAPLISVGILSYERPHLLQHALNSVAAQTYPNLEILISDNCSSNPDVRKVVGEFLGKRPSAKVFFHEKNRGAFWNFRFVLQQATGPLFIWLADDDFWSPDFLATLVAARGSAVPSLTYSKAVPFDLEDQTPGVPAKERGSAKRGIGNVIRQTGFDSDSIVYGLFDTCVGKRHSAFLKSWPVKTVWKSRLPTMEIDFVSYAFLYGMLLEADFINARDFGGIHYMISRPSSASIPGSTSPQRGIFSILRVVIAMAYIHIMLAGRFFQAAVLARHPAGAIFAPFAAGYLFLRRMAKAALPRLTALKGSAQ
ncbi:MAG: glycosyltransferase family 2 protein [Terrimicrobiaceae bacterium]